MAHIPFELWHDAGANSPGFYRRADASRIGRVTSKKLAVRTGTAVSTDPNYGKVVPPVLVPGIVRQAVGSPAALITCEIYSQGDCCGLCPWESDNVRNNPMARTLTHGNFRVIIGKTNVVIPSLPRLRRAPYNQLLAIDRLSLLANLTSRAPC